MGSSRASCRTPPAATSGAAPLLLGGGPPAPACHTGDRSCFDAGLAHGRTAFAAGTPQGFGWLETLWATIGDRAERMPPDSYTTSLLRGGGDAVARQVAGGG